MFPRPWRKPTGFLCPARFHHCWWLLYIPRTALKDPPPPPSPILFINSRVPDFFRLLFRFFFPCFLRNFHWEVRFYSNHPSWTTLFQLVVPSVAQFFLITFDSAKVLGCRKLLDNSLRDEFECYWITSARFSRVHKYENNGGLVFSKV